MNDFSSIKSEIIDFRRKIHMFPEVAFEEYKTSDEICKMLEKYNIPYEKGIAKTGIVACIGKKTDKTLLIRADMDALPMEELTSLPFASQNHGVMHACGHDIHTSAALAAAILLKECESELNGSVKVIFQPAEEGVGGALPMIEEGILHNPDVTCAIAGHITPELDVGKITVKDGALMASPDDFSIKFIGKSTHGAQPQNGISPIVPGAEMISKIENLKEELSGSDGNVLSTCTFISDGSVNIIPEEAIILGTYRSFSDDYRDKACTTIGKAAQEISKKYGVKLEYKYNYLYPPVINDKAVTDAIIDTAKDIVGIENVIKMDKPFMTGEDFSYFGRYVPSCLFWYGGKSDEFYPLHSSHFVANEDAIEVCTNIFFEFAKKYLS